MQIIGSLNISNISNFSIYPLEIKLRKPRVYGHFKRMELKDNLFPKRGVCSLHFYFFIQPPFCQEGADLLADLAVTDQFGNEHWLNGLEFRYR